MRAMTKYHAIEWAATAGIIAAVAMDFVEPTRRWSQPLMVVSIIGLFAGHDPQRPPGPIRRWLAPAILLGLAAQFLLIGSADERSRMMPYAAICVAAAVGLWFWYRPKH